MRKLRTLDLFSGIGGMSYALRSRCRTIAYCERDPSCRACLLRNMKEGVLDSAPIFEDIVALRPEHIPAGTEVVCAGFPCQDLSSAGKHMGLDGERSGLFWQIVRLLRGLTSVKYVLLENVPTILSDGWRVVTEALRKHGFRSTHGIFQANEVGAPHTRKRWFCLAVRDGASEQIVRPPSRLPRAPLRLLKRHGAINYKDRYAMLGNSVVPQAVALAWNTLMKTRFGPAHRRVETGAGTVYVQDAKGVETSVSRSVTVTRLKTPLLLPHGITKYLWATPTAQFNHPFHSFGNTRGFDNLFNQVYYESTAHPELSRKELISTYMVNPAFVEWLMGYPPGYTTSE